MHNLNKICLKKKNMQLVGFKIFLIKKKTNKQTNPSNISRTKTC